MMKNDALAPSFYADRKVTTPQKAFRGASARIGLPGGQVPVSVLFPCLE